MEIHGVFGRVTMLTRLVKATLLRPRITRSFSHCMQSRAANAPGDTSNREAGGNGELLPSYVQRTWTLEELDTFYRMRDESASDRQMAEALGRTIPSVVFMRTRAAALPSEVLRKAVQRQASRTMVVRHFSPQEDSKMLALLANGHARESVAAELGRTVAAVRHRMRRLGEQGAEKQHNGPWTAEEINLLQSWKAERLGVSSIASRLGRSRGSVEYQMRRAQFPQAYSVGRGKTPWTETEDKQLRDLKAQGLSCAQIHELMPHRTAESIKTRYYIVDIKVSGPEKRKSTWTAEEIEILRDLVAQEKSFEDMVAILGRSRASIVGKIKCEMTICRVGAPRWRWSEGDIKNMSRMRVAGLTWDEIAASLGRSANSCVLAFSKYTPPPGALPLYRGKVVSKWSAEEIEVLLDMRASQRSWSEIAASIGRSYTACQRAFYRYRPPSGALPLHRGKT